MANGMYFVETGTVRVLKLIDGEEKEVNIHLMKSCPSLTFQVNELNPGKYFGELGLLHKAPRQATVLARDDVKVACECFLITENYMIVLLLQHSNCHFFYFSLGCTRL